MQAFKEHKSFKRDKTQRNDITESIIALCLIFDLNFKESFEIIKEKNIIEMNLDILKNYLDEQSLELIINELK